MIAALRAILLLLCLYSTTAAAFHAEVNQLTQPQQAKQKLQQLYVQIVPADITLDDLLSDPAYHHSFHLLTDADKVLFSEQQAVWFFARLENKSSRSVTTLLEYDFPLADKIEIYQVNRQTQDIQLLSRSGNDYPFSERKLPYRSFVTTLNLTAASDTDIYIRVQDAAIIPSEVILWREQDFIASKQQQAMLDGLLQGFLLLLAVYNILLFSRSKQRHYLYYAGFFISFALVVAILNGMAFEVLWPGYPEINQAVLYIAVGAGLLCLNLFVHSAMHSITGFWWRVSGYVSNSLALLLLFSPLFAGGQLRLKLLFFAAIWVLGSNLMLAFRLGIIAKHQVKSFVWACVLTLVAAILLTMNQAGYLHDEFNWSYILFALVLICLTLSSFNLHRFQLSAQGKIASKAELQDYHDIFHNAVEGMFTTTLDGQLINANQALINILGYQTLQELKAAVAGTGMTRFYADPSERQFMLQHLERGSKKSFEIRGLRADNSPFWALMSVRLASSDDARKKGYIHGSIIDITEQKLAHEKLAYLANHDALTALYNRYYFEQQLQILCDQSGADKGCVLFIDVDQFRLINNNCNHQAGDALLKQLSEQIKRISHHNGPLARLESDEFGILLGGKNVNEAFSLAYRLLDALREYRFIWQDSVYSISICIGIAEIQQEDKMADSVLKKAEAACNVAKEKGNNRIQLFDANDADTKRLQAEQLWVSHLQQAIEQDHFVIFQQPIVPVQHEATGMQYELLLRLKQANAELISAASFLSSADRYGLMPQIDRWVISNYFKWLQQNPAHLSSLTLCNINLSGNSLLDPTFKDDVQRLFEQYRIPFNRICFEITESVAIINLQDTLSFIEHFRALGCRVALDDFGSGFSSYSYLKHFPADFVKIDGHFVRDLLDDQYDKAIVKSIHEVAHAMDMQTVAEYVESDELLAALKLMGIDYVQGFALGKPAPLTQLAD